MALIMLIGVHQKSDYSHGVLVAAKEQFGIEKLA